MRGWIASALVLALLGAPAYGQPPVPLHLRNAPTGLMRQMGYGRDYKYAHSFDEHFAEQEYRPPEITDRYYEPGELGYEAKIKAWLEHLRSRTAGPKEEP